MIPETLVRPRTHLQKENKMNDSTPTTPPPSSKGLYLAYLGIGSLYLLVKVGFVLSGYLHLGAIAHGAVPAVCTMLAAGLALQQSARGTVAQRLQHLLIALPLLVFGITPLFMYLKQGSARWLTQGRLPVLVLYECMAALQLLLALRAGAVRQNRQ